MRRYVPPDLTPVEFEAEIAIGQQRKRERIEQIIRKGCGGCLHRDIEVFDGVWTCELGRAWPRHGVCRGLEVEGGDD